jgi:hypothetical protein
MTDHEGQPQADADADPWYVPEDEYAAFAAQQPAAVTDWDRLGLTWSQWLDLAYDYTHGAYDPEPGIVADRAFSVLDRYFRPEPEPHAGQVQAEPEPEAGA